MRFWRFAKAEKKGEIEMKYVIRVIQVSILLGGAEFLAMLLFGDLKESVQPVVFGAVCASLILAGVLGILDRKIRKHKGTSC